MGAWGTGVLSDDTVRDVCDEYLDLFNRGASPQEIRSKVLQSYAGSLKDSDEGPLIWFGLAKAQWDCGHLQPEVLAHVRQIIESGEGLDRWAEQGDALLQRREGALKQFLSKLETPNPRPKKPRKAIKRKPIFEPGDCLAVRTKDGDWGAILILQGPPQSEDPYVETFGTNLAVTLRYKGRELPGMHVFEKREWLCLTHHNWRNHLDVCNVMAIRFRTVKDRFVVVGKIALRPDDPASANSYTSWPNMMDAMYLQDRWDSGIRD